MRSPSASFRVFAVTLSVMLAAAATAAAQSITDLASKVNLTQQDRQAISEYATQYGGVIRDAHLHPDKVREAKRRLAEPLKAPRIGQVFLEAYSRELGGVLEEAIENGSPHAASNALIILSQLGTESALNRLLNRCDIRDEKRESIRLVAARGCRDLLKSRFLDDNIRPIPGAARRLRDAASREPSPLVLRRQLEGISAGDRPQLDAGTRRQLFEYVATAMQQAALRAADPQLGAEASAELMDSVHSVLGRVKQALTDLADPALQTWLAEQLMEPTMQLLEAPLEHWDALHADNGLQGDVTGMVEQGERTLETLVLFSRGRGRPAEGVNLTQKWSSGDREQYEEGLEAWRQHLPGN